MSEQERNPGDREETPAEAVDAPPAAGETASAPRGDPGDKPGAVSASSAGAGAGDRPPPPPEPTEGPDGPPTDETPAVSRPAEAAQPAPEAAVTPDPSREQEAAAGAIAPTPPPLDVPGAPDPLSGVSTPVGTGPGFIQEHPEALVGGAFLGGLLIAALLRRRGR